MVCKLCLHNSVFLKKSVSHSSQHIIYFPKSFIHFVLKFWPWAGRGCQGEGGKIKKIKLSPLVPNDTQKEELQALRAAMSWGIKKTMAESEFLFIQWELEGQHSQAPLGTSKHWCKVRSAPERGIVLLLTLPLPMSNLKKEEERSLHHKVVRGKEGSRRWMCVNVGMYVGAHR